MKKKAQNAEPSLEKERLYLKKSALNAIDKIIEIAESGDTDMKLRVDAYKWICEMYFGKPQNAGKNEPESEKLLHLSFEGDLDKWSS